MKKSALTALTVAFAAFVSVSCSDDAVPPPVIDLEIWLEGERIAASEGVVTATPGTRVDYVFTINASTTIVQVRTINSVILSDKVKTVDETITMGFTDRLTDQVRGTIYIPTIGTEVKIVVTDTYGNEAQRAITVYPGEE